MMKYIERIKRMRRGWRKMSSLIMVDGIKRWPGRSSLILRLQMIWSQLYEGCLFVEYFWYHWPGRTRKEGKAFVYAMERESLLRRINSVDKISILTNKWETYKYFQQYFKRKVWLNGQNISREDILNMQKCGGVIFKPLSSNCGYGVRLEKISSFDDITRIGSQYNGGYLVEEVVVQHPTIGALHPQSVNTLRINSCLLANNRVFVFAPVLRIGRGGNVVDNAGAGGIIAALDSNGVVIACGDEHCNTFSKHPDTGVSLIGFKIPQYNLALNIVKEMALMLPSVRLIGWDLAYTDNGWVLIEANANPNLLWQIATRKGIRDDFEKIQKPLE